MVDWSRVKELRNEVGDEDFNEILSMFLDETDAVIRRLPDAKTAKEIEGELHFLKGGALNIGMARFAALCQVGEKRAAEGRTDVDLAEIETVYAESRSALLAGLAQLEAA